MDGFRGGRRLVWICRMVRRALGSGGGSLLVWKILRDRRVVQDVGCYVENHDRVCIVFGHCGCIILDRKVMEIGYVTLMVD